MKKFILVFALWFFGLLPVIAQSYNNTVHFFLTSIVVENIEPALTKDEKHLVSFCAQLPDETEEYDAMRQYWKLAKSGDYWSWARHGNDNMSSVLSESKAAKELVTVQQLLHGLTGGNATEMLTTADNILATLMREVVWNQSSADKATRLCAVGFAVHLLGDTLAHRRLDSGGLDTQGEMYKTGRGHAFDGKKPDNLLESVTGLDGLKRYDSTIPSLLPDTRTLGAGQLQELYTKLDAASKKWFRAAAAARQIIIEEAGSWAIVRLVRPDRHNNENCQAYLNKVVTTITDGQCVPDCDSVFTLFADTAKVEFQKSHPSRLPKLSLDEYVYPTAEGDPLACSISDNPAPDF